MSININSKLKINRIFCRHTGSIHYEAIEQSFETIRAVAKLNHTEAQKRQFRKQRLEQEQQEQDD